MAFDGCKTIGLKHFARCGILRKEKSLAEGLQSDGTACEGGCFMYLVIKRFCAIFMVVFLIMAIFGCVEEKEFVVSRVIDGDTIELADGITIRYIGVNTPEVGQPGAEEATEANRALVEGKKVRLEYDVQKQDKYGRTLAYVYLEDGTFVNAELVKNGKWKTEHGKRNNWKEI